MSTTTIRYIGTQDRWPEVAVTGKQNLWFRGQTEGRPDREAAALLATGLFQPAVVPAQFTDRVGEYDLLDPEGRVVAFSRASEHLPALRPFETFGRISEWTLASSGDLASITQVNRPGLFAPTSLRFSSAVGSNSNASATKNMRWSQDSEGYPYVGGFWLLSDVAFKQTAVQVGITMFASPLADLGGTNRWQYANAIPANAIGLQPVWVPRSGWTVLDGSPNWSAEMLSLRVRIDSHATEFRDWSLRGAFVGGGRPTVIITLDDGYDSSYSIGHVQARRRGIPLSHYVIPQLIGTTGGGNTYLTPAELAELIASDDYVGLHGAQRWDQDLSRIDADVAACRAMGIDTRHAAYPEGAVGAGYSWPATVQRLQSFGVQTARLAGNNQPVLRSVGDPLLLNSYPLNNTMSLSAALAAVDAAELSGGTVIFYGHKFGSTADSLTWVTADWTAFLDNLFQRRLLGTVDLTTIDRWWDQVTPSYQAQMRRLA